MDPQELFNEFVFLIRKQWGGMKSEEIKRAEDLAERLLPRVLSGFIPRVEGVKTSKNWAIDVLREWRRS